MQGKSKNRFRRFIYRFILGFLLVILILVVYFVIIAIDHPPKVEDLIQPGYPKTASLRKYIYLRSQLAQEK